MGSGRVGAMVATILDQQGHSVAIIDRDSAAFRLLPPSFSGRKVKGVGFDRDTLKKAGIEDAYAFAAVSNGDNTNILATRIARETFGVERVVTRIYDPKRAEVYERMGIPTIGTVRWSASMILNEILPEDSDVIFNDARSNMVLMRCHPIPEWIGVSDRAVEEATNARLCYVRRFDKAVMPSASNSIHIQEGDELYMSVPVDNTEEVRHIFSHPPQIER